MIPNYSASLHIWSSFTDDIPNPSFSWLQVSCMQNAIMFHGCQQLF